MPTHKGTGGAMQRLTRMGVHGTRGRRHAQEKAIILKSSCRDGASTLSWYAGWLLLLLADGRLALLRSASAGSAGSGNASCVPPRCDTCFGDGGAPQGPYFPLWGASTILLLLLPPHRGTVLAAYLHH